MKTFENKTVLITGGTSGIGKATALAFANEGAIVVVSGRRVAEGEEVAREITSAGGNALFVQTDVAREDDIVALVEKTVGAFGAEQLKLHAPLVESIPCIDDAEDSAEDGATDGKNVFEIEVLH